MNLHIIKMALDCYRNQENVVCYLGSFTKPKMVVQVIALPNAITLSLTSPTRSLIFRHSLPTGELSKSIYNQEGYAKTTLPTSYSDLEKDIEAFLMLTP